MRSLVLVRYSLVAALTVVAAAAVQLAQVSVTLPQPNLHMAWTLTRVLIQL
jgi:hypothetical protein